MKKKLFLALIVVLLVCLAIMPCAFADYEDAGGREQEAGELQAASCTAAEPQVSSEEAGDWCSVPGDWEETAPEAEVPAEEELQEASCMETEEAVVPAEEKSEENTAEAVVSSEETAESSVNAVFTGENGSVYTLGLGGSVDLSDFIASLGYEGEVESFVSSNPEALGLDEEGRLVFKTSFTDETVTVVINGEEIVIPVHDPWFARNEAELIHGFTEGLPIQMMKDIEVNTTLNVASGKSVTLNLNGHTLSFKGSGSVITVSGTFILNNDPVEGSSGGTGIITGGNAEKGGGVYVSGSGAKFTMNSGTITGCQATDGGGVYVDNHATFNLTGGKITNNTATNGGGVIVAEGAIFSMTGGIISDNSASGNGGGVYVTGTAGYTTNTGIMKFKDGTIENNTAANGGGLYADAHGIIEMTGGKITGNTATNGGGAYNNGVLTLTGGEITGNKADLGGGVYTANGNLTVGGSLKIINNTVNGGTDESNLYLPDGIKVSVSNTAVPNGMEVSVSAEKDKSGATPIVITYGDMGSYARNFLADNLNYETANVNKAVALVYVKYNPDKVAINAVTGESYSTVSDALFEAGYGHTIMLLVDCQEYVYVYGNTVTLDLNGKTLTAEEGRPAIYVAGDSKAKGNLTIEDSSAERSGTVTGGKGYLIDHISYGGGIYVNGGIFTLNGGIITGNKADYGGGICVDNNGIVTINGGSINGNYSTTNGGGAAAFGGGSINMTGGSIKGNTAVLNGGGVDIFGGASFNMAGGEISGNISKAYGGGVYFVNSSMTMTGGTITGNTARNSGGGVFVNDLTSVLTVGGNAYINGNTLSDGTTESNVYLFSDNDAYNTVTISSETAPVRGMEIGVTTRTKPTEGKPVPVTSNKVTGEFARYFISDNPDYVLRNKDGIVVLTDMRDVPEAAYNEDKDKYYLTLQAAIDDAGKGDFIHVLDHLYEDITIASGKEVVIDLNGKMLLGTSTGPVIYVEGELTLKDYSSERDGIVRDGTGYNINGTSYGGGIYVHGGKFTLYDGIITANEAVVGGGIFVDNNGNVIINGGSITGNKSTYYGGGVAAAGGGSINVYGGSITGNWVVFNGGGVGIYDGASFNMAGGEISGNEAELGGGVYFVNSSMTMTGGKITGNTARKSGGGVIVNDLTSDLNVGGNAYINGNTLSDGTTENNVYLLSDNDAYNTVTISVEKPPVKGMEIGVTTRTAPTEGMPIPVTSNDVTGEFARYFISDNTAYITKDKDGMVVLAVTHDTDKAAYNENKKVYYPTLQDAIDKADAGDTIRILDDLYESIIVDSSKEVVIDLNGTTLKPASGGESVITVNGKLTLIDTSEGQTGKITGSNNCGVSVNGTFIMGDGTCSGGEISGNNSCGVYVSGSGAKFTMNSGIISGNTAESGGGVSVNTGAVFTMNGGQITNNSAGAGGGVFVFEGTFNMVGGEISGNTAVDFGGGVANYGTFNMTGGKITGNVSKSSGGVDNIGTFNMTGGVISGNTAEIAGGGVINYNDMTVGGNAQITGNTAGGAENNLYLASGKIVAIDTAALNGMEIGISSEIVPKIDSPVDITSGDGTGVYLDYFSSDSESCFIFSDSVVKLAFLNEDTVAINVNTGAQYSKLKDAIQAVEEGSATIRLLKDVTEGYLKVGETDEGESLENLDITIDLNGHSISATNAEYIILVYPTCSLTIDDSSAEKNGSIINTELCNHIIRTKGVLTLKEGNLSFGEGPQSAVWVGAGVYVDKVGTFNMMGGSITGCISSNAGGGVYNLGIFNMTGGEIFGNTASGNGGGVYNAGVMTVGGDAVIAKNTAGGSPNNLYLANTTVSLNNPIPGMEIWVTTSDKPDSSKTVPVTSGDGSGDYVVYFTSDDARFYTFSDEGVVKLGFVDENAVAYVKETGRRYAYVYKAVEAAANGYTVVMLKDSEENVTVASGKTVTLDLNGHVLKADLTDKKKHSVITVNGTLKLIDSDPNAVHTDDYSDLPAGGVITGGNADNGGGVLVSESGSFVMNRGNISQNNAASDGGGVCVDEGGSFTMNGGKITGNTASNGGGVCADEGGSFTMTGGDILANKASKGGGVFVDNESSFTMTGGEILANEAKFYGGGVFVDNESSFTMTGGNILNNAADSWYGGGVYNSRSTFKMTGGKISGNTSKVNGGGVFNDGGMTVGGSANITGNTAGENNKKNNNLYVLNNKEFSVSTESKPQAGMSVGIITETTPTSGSPKKFAYNAVADDCKYFTPDIEEASVRYKDNSLYLAIVETVQAPTIGTVTYNGKPQAAVIDVTDKPYTVTENKGGTDAGEYDVVLTLTDTLSYEWENSTDANITLTFTINPLTAEIFWSCDPMVYDGTKQAPTATVANVVKGDTVTVTVSGAAKDAGTYTAKATALSNKNYKLPDDVSYKFIIEQRTAEISWSTDIFIYDGTEQAPTATVTNAVGRDTVTVTVSGAGTDAGSHTAEATALSNANYKLPSSASNKYYINPKFISNAVVEFVEDELAYTGSEQSVKVKSVTVDGLTVDTYTLSGDTSATEIGSYTLTVIASGNFKGSASASWSIVEKPIPVPPAYGTQLARYRLDLEYFYDVSSAGPFEMKMYFVNAPVLTEQEREELIVKIDGVIVDPANYEITVLESGDVVITFTEEFMSTLSEGSHEVIIEFSNAQYHTVLTVKEFPDA